MPGTITATTQRSTHFESHFAQIRRTARYSNDAIINPVFIQTFISITQTRSFIRTAMELGMTQPGVTQHIDQLEEHLGVKLINRERNKHGLTDAGEKFLEYAVSLFREYNEIKAKLRADSPFSGDLRIASVGSFGLMLHTFFMDLNMRYRDLVFYFSEASHRKIIDGILNESYDLGFVTQRIADLRIFSCIIDKERLRIVVPRGFKGKTFDDLVRLGFVDHPDGRYGLYRMIQEIFPAEMKKLEDVRVSSYVNNIEKILEPVAKGMGFTVLPEYTCKHFSKKDRIAYFSLTSSVVDNVYFIRKKDRDLGNRFDFVIKELRNRVKANSYMK
jgi:LysR family transcriptional regulator, transcriptional activator of the cysJI operon